MSIRTITKICCFVISVCLGNALFASCSANSFGGAEPTTIDNNSQFEEPEVIAKINSSEITESSGLAVSKCQPNVFWTHNDSGDGPFLYAFDSGGKKLGTWRVNGASNVDWEDMATSKTSDGRCYLYVGEIGDNARRRDVHFIYRVSEPLVSPEAVSSSKKAPREIDTFQVLKFSYDKSRHDAEALLVHPATSDIYVVTKSFSGPADVFKLRPVFDSGETQAALRVSSISLPAVPNGLVTGGEISPDGKRVVLCDYYAGYELVLPGDGATFDDIWTQTPGRFDLGPRELGESIAYGDDENTVFATTEKANPPLIRVRRKVKK